MARPSPSRRATYSQPKRSTWRIVADVDGRAEGLLAQQHAGVGVVVVHVGGDAVAVGSTGSTSRGA